MFKNNEIELPESLSDISNKNAIKFFTKKGLNDTGSEKSIKYYSDVISEYLNLLHY